MDAKHKLIGDVDVLYLSGKMNLDSVEKLQEVCYQNFLGKKIIFCLDNLSFVGSTGITILLNTVRRMSQAAGRPIKFSNVCSEYHKIFTANLVGVYENYENLDRALMSYTLTRQNMQIRAGYEAQAHHDSTEKVNLSTDEFNLSDSNQDQISTAINVNNKDVSEV